MAPATANHLPIDRLRQLANDPEATLAELCSVLNSLSNPDDESRQWACEALENCGVPPSDQLPLISGYLKQADTLMVYWACKLLASMERDALPAQSQLVDVLRIHPDLTVREEAAQALKMQGELSPGARSALEQAATDGGPRLKRIANAALGR